MLLQGDILTLRHVRAELVLGLHHDDRAAFRYLQVADLLVKLIDIKLRAFQELRVIPADLHARYILQPPRITAELPLGAYVRAGTEDHHQSLLSRYPDILGQILVSLEIPFTRFRLVQVPEDIGSDRIQAHRPHHPKAMPPILVETLEIFPKKHPQYQKIVDITRNLMQGLKDNQDVNSGLWYQIVDKGNRFDNWQETSGSGMFIYSMQRAIELGIIQEKEYANCIKRGYIGLLSKVRINKDDGLIDLCDANNGLGIQKDYDAYVTRPRKRNGQEVISSFLWATTIVENKKDRISYVKPSPCETFVCTDYSQGKVFVFEKGEKVWEHDAPLSNDIWVLDNGNLLFTKGNGVLEVTRNNDTIFQYTSQSHVFACQRLTNGNTFVGECESGRLLEVDSNGKIVKDLSILPLGTTNGKKSFMRNARKLENGHYLVAHYGGKRVVEYDENGNIYWEVPVSGGAHSVIRLPNGNTLVAVTDMDKNPRIVEFNSDKNIVWEFSNKDIEGAPLKFLSGMQYIPGMGIVFTNWTGHVKEKVPYIYWVDWNKNIIDTFGPCADIESVSSVFIPLKNEKVYH